LVVLPPAGASPPPDDCDGVPVFVLSHADSKETAKIINSTSEIILTFFIITPPFGFSISKLLNLYLPVKFRKRIYM